MLSALEIDGKSLLPIKEAVSATTYSRDYITRLAREGKIVASFIGRQWFIDVDSLRGYAESIALEQEARKRLLSEERKRERQLREAALAQHTVHLKKAHTLHARSLVAASLVLGVGLFTGYATYSVIAPSLSSVATVAERAAAPATSGSFIPQADRMPAQTSAATPATPTPAAADLPKVASMDQRPLGDAREGVLLLPQGGETTEVPALFSDTVEVRQNAAGEQVVVPVDAAGNPVGKEIPFVVVPVTEAEM